MRVLRSVLKDERRVSGKEKATEKEVEFWHDMLYKVRNSTAEEER